MYLCSANKSQTHAFISQSTRTPTLESNLTINKELASSYGTHILILTGSRRSTSNHVNSRAHNVALDRFVDVYHCLCSGYCTRLKILLPCFTYIFLFLNRLLSGIG